MLMFDGRRDAPSVLLRLGIVALTLSTAYIHFTLGGLMFLANAGGYLLLGLAMIAPLPVASRYRWLIRGLLLLFAVATIGGWLMFGARYWLGYLAKAIELGLIALLAVEMLRYDDGPVAVAQRAWTLGLSVLRRLTGRSAA